MSCCHYRHFELQHLGHFFFFFFLALLNNQTNKKNQDDSPVTAQTEVILWLRVIYLYVLNTASVLNMTLCSPEAF